MRGFEMTSEKKKQEM